MIDIDYVPLRTDQDLDGPLSTYLASALRSASAEPLGPADRPDLDLGPSKETELLFAAPVASRLLVPCRSFRWASPRRRCRVIIHLLNRRKYREVPWAAMRFLVAAMQQESAPGQGRAVDDSWPIRTLLVDPAGRDRRWPSRSSRASGAMQLLTGQRTHRVIVLDG